jgi:hypothetical protein
VVPACLLGARARLVVRAFYFGARPSIELVGMLLFSPTSTGLVFSPIILFYFLFCFCFPFRFTSVH